MNDDNVKQTFELLLRRASELPFGNSSPILFKQRHAYHSACFDLINRQLTIDLEKLKQFESITQDSLAFIIAHEIGHSRHSSDNVAELIFRWGPTLWHRAEYFADWYASLLIGKDSCLAYIDNRLCSSTGFVEAPTHPSWYNRYKAIKEPVWTNPNLKEAQTPIWYTLTGNGVVRTVTGHLPMQSKVFP